MGTPENGYTPKWGPVGYGHTGDTPKVGDTPKMGDTPLGVPLEGGNPIMGTVGTRGLGTPRNGGPLGGQRERGHPKRGTPQNDVPWGYTGTPQKWETPRGTDTLEGTPWGSRGTGVTPKRCPLGGTTQKGGTPKRGPPQNGAPGGYPQSGDPPKWGSPGGTDTMGAPQKAGTPLGTPRPGGPQNVPSSPPQWGHGPAAPKAIKRVCPASSRSLLARAHANQLCPRA